MSEYGYGGLVNWRAGPWANLSIFRWELCMIYEALGVAVLKRVNYNAVRVRTRDAGGILYADRPWEGCNPSISKTHGTTCIKYSRFVWEWAQPDKLTSQVCKKNEFRRENVTVHVKPSSAASAVFSKIEEAVKTDGRKKSSAPRVTRADKVYKLEWSSPIVLKEYKLVIFSFPKVVCTVLRQLARRM